MRYLWFKDYKLLRPLILWSRTHHSNLCTRWENKSSRNRSNNQQLVLPKDQACWHPLVRPIILKVRDWWRLFNNLWEGRKCAVHLSPNCLHQTHQQVWSPPGLISTITVGIFPPARVLAEDLTKATLREGSPNLLQMASKCIGKQTTSELTDSHSAGEWGGTKDNKASSSKPGVLTVHSNVPGSSSGAAGGSD